MNETKKKFEEMHSYCLKISDFYEHEGRRICIGYNLRARWIETKNQVNFCASKKGEEIFSFTTDGESAANLGLAFLNGAFLSSFFKNKLWEKWGDMEKLK